MCQRIDAWIALVFLTPAFGSAQAQETILKPIVVTASREAEPADEALAAVTVITREDIEAQQPQSVLDLLRGHAGIDVSRNGGLGSVSSVFMRGAESDQVLVLIDGVRAGAATTGTFSFQHLNPAQIERIEIVRGPRSTLYGSDAIGGVIQIFTRKLDGPAAAVEAGSYDTYRAEAGYGGGERVLYSVNGAYVHSGGFSAQNPDGHSFDPDDDGYNEASATANLDAVLSESASLSLNGWHSNGEIEFDQGEIDTLNDTVALNLALATLPAWQQAFSAGYARDDQKTESADFPSEATTDRVTFNWQNDIRLSAAHQLTLGADYYQDDGAFISDFSTYDEDVNDLGMYANLRSALGRNDLQLGLRFDEHSEFGGHVTGQIAYGREFTDSLHLYTAFGTAFKAPTLNELFFPGFGNPNLDPERSRSTELGFKYGGGAAGPSVRASLFYIEIDDLIETVFVGPGPFDFQARNVEEATTKGLELVLDQSFGARWHASANLTWQDAHNDTDDTELVRRPDQKLTFGITRRFACGGTFYAELLLNSERTDVGDVELPGYGLVNLSLQYPLLKNVFAEARVENLLDKDYELAAGFNTPGRAGYVGLRYSPVGQ